MLLIIGYLAVALVVVALSVKASEYIDMLDSRTRLSGAFFGRSAALGSYLSA